MLICAKRMNIVWCSVKKLYLCITFLLTTAMKRIFKTSEVIKILTSLGWYLDRQNGTSHRQYKHPQIHRTVTVDGKPSQDVNINNLKSMERQAGIKFSDYI